MRLVVLCLAVLLGCSYGATAKPRGSPPSLDRPASERIPIVVFARAGVTDSLLNQVCAEADAIWRPAGITFAWYRVVPKDAPGGLEVTIDDRRYGTPGWHEALGWITFTPDGPGRSIHLSLAATEDMLRSAMIPGNTTIRTHDMLVGRALGRALAHELGHYFLKSKAHGPHGLMRATWTSDQFFAISRTKFQLTAQEQEAAVEHLPRLRDGE